MKIKIDKDIPAPEKRPYTHNDYPFEKMNVGDSFQLEGEDFKSTLYLRNKITQAAKKYALVNKNEAKFTTKITDNSVRVWRIK